MKRLVIVLPWVLLWAVLGLSAGCPGSPSTRSTPSRAPGSASEGEATRLARLFAELQDDILTSYERDDPLDLDTGMIDPRVGTVRIGVGPGDVYVSGEPARPASRWPLDIDRSDGSTRTYVRSKRLEIQIAADRTAAWMVDELSWRIEMCRPRQGNATGGFTAVIPLRITALYAHDGDRWVPVFEHLSFGWPPTPIDDPHRDAPKSIKTEVASGDLRDELWDILGGGLLRTPHDPLVVAQDASALVIGPDAGDEWHAAQVLQARSPSAVPLLAGRLEDRRVGLVGRDPGAATVAYWAGNYVADVAARPGGAAGKVRMRVTHVFEKRHASALAGARDHEPSDAESCAPPKEKAKDRAKVRDKNADCRWVLVQSHMSQPISDDELTRWVFGTALISAKPFAIDCSGAPALDGSRPAMAPAVVPRREATPPAPQTP